MNDNRISNEDLVFSRARGNGDVMRGYNNARQQINVLNRLDDEDELQRYSKALEEFVTVMENRVADLQKLNDNKEAEKQIAMLQKITTNMKGIDDVTKDHAERVKQLNAITDVMYKNVDHFDSQQRKMIESMNNSFGGVIDAAENYSDVMKQKTATLGQTLTKSFQTVTNELQQFANTINLHRLATGNIQSTSDFREMQTTMQRTLNVNADGYQRIQNAVVGQNGELKSLGISMKDSMNYLSNIKDYQLKNSEQAVAMYKQISIGTKYLGLSNQNLAAMVKATNAMADDSYMQKQIALLEALGTDEGLSEDLSSMAQWTAENINSIAARNNDPTKFIRDAYAYQTAADAMLGPQASLLNSMTTEIGSTQSFDQLSESTKQILSMAGMSGQLQSQMMHGNVDMDSVYRSVLNTLSSKDVQKVLDYEGYGDWTTLGATFGRQSDKFMSTVRNQYKALGQVDLNDPESLKKMEENIAKQNDTRTHMEKTVDAILANVKSLPKATTVLEITTILSGIGAVAKIFGSFAGGESGSVIKALLQKLTGKGAGEIAGSGAGNGILSKLFGSGAGAGSSGAGAAGAGGAGLGTALLGGGLILGGLGVGAYQATKTKNWKGGWARGAFLGTANSEQSNGEQAKSILANTAKYTAIGAGIGTIVPGIGTAIGAAVGAGVGLITGGIGGLIKKQKDATDENTEAINKNTASTDKLSASSDSTVTNSAFSAYYRAMMKDSEGSGGVDRGYKSSNIVYGESGEKTGKGGYPWSLTSDYGPRKHPISGEASFHTGIDLAVGQGTKIGSATDGKVQEVGYGSGVGNYTLIRGKNGKYYHYWHQVQRPPVSKGQNVVAGQLIGYVGSTGWSTGPHLHFQVNKSPWSGDMNPKPYVTGSIFKASGAKWDGKFSGKDWKDNSKSSGNSAASLMEALVDDQNSTIQSQGTAKYIAKETAFSTNKGKGGVDKLSVTPNYATSEDVNRLIQVITELNEAQNDQKSLLQALSGKNTFVFK